MEGEREGGKGRERDREGGGGRAEEKGGSELAKVTKCEKDNIKEACFTCTFFSTRSMSIVLLRVVKWV